MSALYWQISHSHLLRNHWLQLMAGLAMQPNLDTYAALISAYSAPYRHYHNTHHLEFCIEQLSQTQNLAQAPAEVGLALWFHDAIYLPLTTHNEQASADWALRFLANNAADSALCARISSHIMATDHNTVPVNADTALVTDIDLAILGQPSARYAQFEQEIRTEYGSVPLTSYNRRRAAILTNFLNRPTIYTTTYYQEHYEAQARINLQSAIHSMQAHVT